METKTLYKFKKESVKEDIEKLSKFETKSDEINKAKEFLLFKKIIKKSQGKVQAVRFQNGLDKLNKKK